MAPDYTRGHSVRSAVFKRVGSVSSCKTTFGSTMRMGPAPIADNGLMTKEVVTTTRIATMHLIIRPLSARTLPLKPLFAGCSKRSHRRGARKIDPSTSAQDRLPTRSRNRMLEGVNASLHHSITPPLHYSSPRYVAARRLSATKHMGLFQQAAKG